MKGRTLRAWSAIGPDEQRARPGRPARAASEVEAARERVRAVLDAIGWTAGEGPVHAELGGAVPLRLVRGVLRELKAQHAARRQAAREEARVSVEVLCRDVLWPLDATALARTAQGGVLSSEVLREGASGVTLATTVQAQKSSATDVVALLDAQRVARGGAPLVLATDGAREYVAGEVDAWCELHGVLRLVNAPHTPQHNARAERGIGELKREAGLGVREGGGRRGRKLVLLDEGEVRARIEGAKERLDERRPRQRFGWKTRAEAYRELPHWSVRATREEVLARVACARERLVSGCAGGRARLLAEREAIHGTLEELQLLKRTRGRSQESRVEVAGIS